ncbi:lysophospholipid acyltransferase family protein [Candidatus Pelagibacter sp.]|nr:lysophospholipid acyltransferase family protein [Candidatus Pelagibacter sp.]
MKTIKIIKYFFEFFFILIFFFIFKILGYKLASNLGAKIIGLFGPLFRPKKRILSNITKSLKDINDNDAKNILNNMWSNYGRILSDYVFIKDFRNSNLDSFLTVEGLDILNKIKQTNEPVIFVSGHFNNFELMAMQIEKSGINVAAIYRPLNNIFLNKIMENIRIKYICKNQIKKGLSGTRELLQYFKKNHSIALMIDQRVTEGIKINFYERLAFTTTIPAQLVKKYKCKVVPIYIERINKFNYKMCVNSPLTFSETSTIENITTDLNNWLEKMIRKNPSQWIWSHDRWK